MDFLFLHIGERKYCKGSDLMHCLITTSTLSPLNQNLYHLEHLLRLTLPLPTHLSTKLIRVPPQSLPLQSLHPLLSFYLDPNSLQHSQDAMLAYSHLLEFQAISSSVSAVLGHNRWEGYPRILLGVKAFRLRKEGIASIIPLYIFPARSLRNGRPNKRIERLPGSSLFILFLANLLLLIRLRMLTLRLVVWNREVDICPLSDIFQHHSSLSLGVFSVLFHHVLFMWAVVLSGAVAVVRLFIIGIVKVCIVVTVDFADAFLLDYYVRIGLFGEFMLRADFFFYYGESSRASVLGCWAGFDLLHRCCGHLTRQN